MKAVILCAGKGERLRPLTDNTPKPLVEVQGKPIIFHVLEALPKDITEIILVIGYLGDQVKNIVGDDFNGTPVKYVTQKEQKGTQDALNKAKSKLKENFLVLNCDELLDPTDLSYLAKRPNSFLVAPFRFQVPYGVWDKGTIKEKPVINLTIATGAYHLTPEVFNAEQHEVLAETAGRMKLNPIPAISFDTLTTQTDYERLNA